MYLLWRHVFCRLFKVTLTLHLNTLLSGCLPACTPGTPRYSGIPRLFCVRLLLAVLDVTTSAPLADVGRDVEVLLQLTSNYSHIRHQYRRHVFSLADSGVRLPTRSSCTSDRSSRRISSVVGYCLSEGRSFFFLRVETRRVKEFVKLVKGRKYADGEYKSMCEDL